MKIKINFAGPLTTVQDGGRLGYMSVGFSAGGAMDVHSMRVANILVGNPRDEGALEITFMGIEAEFDSDTVIAITGADMLPAINGEPISTYEAISVHSGDVLSMKAARSGMRAYLAVSGGFELPKVMGSLSTNLKCGIGGLEGRKLRAGDEICLHRSTRLIGERKTEKENEYEKEICVRVIFGPQDDYFTERGISDFLSSEYTVSEKSDRMGVRLSGKPVENKNGVDIISDGIVMGSVQIPASGEPIIMMADRQTTGGYAKIATVITADLSLIAQAAPGTKIRFKRVTERQALKALKLSEKQLLKLECKLNSTKRG